MQMKKYDLTITEAADLVGIHYTTIARLCRENRLDHQVLKDTPRWQPRIRVNRDDVLATWPNGANQAGWDAKKREQRKTQVKLRKTNSSKRVSHKAEIWDVLNPDGVVAYTGTFAQCLKEKPAIELQARQYHTMEMRGGQREVDHSTSQGQRWAQIDRYNFHRDTA